MASVSCRRDLTTEAKRRLLEGADPVEHVWAAWALGLELGATARPELLSALRSDPSPGPRRQLLVVLAGLGERGDSGLRRVGPGRVRPRDRVSVPRADRPARRRMHTSEFASLANAWMRVYLAEGKPDEARSWLAMVRQVYPEHSSVVVWERRLEDRFSSMADRAGIHSR